jgi:hypothetical protein
LYYTKVTFVVLQGIIKLAWDAAAQALEINSIRGSIPPARSAMSFARAKGHWGADGLAKQQ